ncbi:MAG: energy transducer TonB [Bacteroidota bacterium]
MKNSNLFLVFALLTLVTFSCQKDDDEVLEKVICWVEVDGVFEQLEIDKPPVYINGSSEGLTLAIIENINYPAEAREGGIEGKVEVEYQITETGEVDIIEIIKDIGGGCGDATKEALKLATTGISFYPAELNGEKVRVKKEESITFKLE